MVLNTLAYLLIFTFLFTEKHYSKPLERNKV